ncbi:unnamed protein product [Blepharisma stoltei]|uniref:DUF676 domain-containing protein n=1 Tax=Blepharisma stoltei TaxID=1481888 RepID=A0AAU9ISW2_9CILI|nr:unnamed protein product [Blepharisma stoltei]
MSLKGIVEVAIHVESFRNIDLFHQGLYFLKFSVYTATPASVTPAHPYNVISTYVVRSKRTQKHDPHHVMPAGKDESTKIYYTRAFLIRYCEEEVELNDIGYFRTEIDEELNILKKEIFIDVELMFSDLGGEVTPEKAYEMVEEHQLEFKSVAKSKLTLSAGASGMHEFYPLVFSENYFSIANLMVHTSLLDFRYRVLPQISSPKNSKQKLGYTSFAEYLFKDSKGKPKSYVGAEETDKIYHKYIEMMANSYEKLRNCFLLFTGKCLNQREKESLGPICLPPHLTLPGSQVQVSYPLNRKNFIDSMNESSAALDYIDENKEDRPEISLSSISGLEEERQGSGSRFSERVASHDPTKIAGMLLTDINLMAGQLLQLWHRLLDLVKLAPRPLSTLLQENFSEKFKERWSESIIRNVIKTKDFNLSSDENIGVTHDIVAQQRRQDRVYRTPEPMPIEEEGMLPSPEIHPILFEDICIREINSAINSMHPLSQSTGDSFENFDSEISFKQNTLYRGVHLIVLVHGFQGNHFDMRLMKNNIATVHPEALFLCSNSNEDSTEGDIGEMGVRLAQEVMNFISEWCPNKSLGRLSFIGHSLGGLIIRSALPYLEQYSSRMHLYMSFSSPHLGYMYNSSRIIDAGMWLLKKWRKSRCLQQLTMGDNRNMRQTFMYELSTKKGLGWFKQVALVSSFQDQYVPYDSARMEVSQRAANDPDKGEIYMEMASNLLSLMSVDTLYRLDINFKIAEKSLDSFIGRAAHIQFLENQTLMKMIIYRYPELLS